LSPGLVAENAADFSRSGDNCVVSLKITVPGPALIEDESPRLTRLFNDPGVVRLFRWISMGGLAVLVLLTFGFLGARAAAPLSDPDTWWHLVMGEKFLDGTSIRHPGPMSYFGTEDWRPRDWLTQILAARVFGWWGLPGVAWLYGLGLVLFAVVVYRIARANTSFAAAVLATPIAVMASMTSLTARPQLVSFILLAVTVGAVIRTADDLRPRWWLAVLTGVWACMHGMWFLSPLIQGAVLVGLLLDRRVDRGRAARIASVMVLSIAAVAVTPNGAYLVVRPLGTSLAIAQHIQEYQPPNVGSLYYALTLLMLGVTVLMWARGSKATWVSIVLVLVAAGFAVQMQRTTTIGAIIVTPMFAQALDGWLARLDLDPPKAMERLLVYGSALLTLVALALTVPSTADRPGDNLPVAFDRQLDKLPASAVLLNELSDGGYLTWRHRTLRVVEDGLSDQYTTDWHLDYFDATQPVPGWENFLQRTGATYALLGKDRPILELLEQNGWTVIAEDEDKALLHLPDGG
jgi:hypothetical protein